MERRHRDILNKNKHTLCVTIDIRKIKPFLIDSGIFTHAMLNDILCESEPESVLLEELPSRGPNAFVDFINVLRKSNYNNIADVLCKLAAIPEQLLMYKMTSKPIGRCLLINNQIFDKNEDRAGSDVDFKKLSNLFHILGYDVQTEENLTSVNLKKCLQDFSSSKSLCEVDSCAVVILSHGNIYRNLDVIEGTDGENVSKLTVLRMFADSNYLKNKPKFFIFQMCRGSKEDYDYPSVSTDASQVNQYPSKTDMLIVHSALPNHVSYRDSENGTFLIQKLVPIFTDYYLEKDAEAMLDLVNREVREMRAGLYFRQILHIESGLKGLLYFSMPQFSEDDKSKFVYT